MRRIERWYEVNWWLIFLLVFVGVVIFFFSLYGASLSGLRRQLGLVGGDVNQSIDVNQLYRGVTEVGQVPRCDYYRAIAVIPKYVFARGTTKLILSKEAAKMRVECAIVYTLRGNAERGVYTIMKALRYEQSGLLYLERIISEDRTNCSYFQTSVSLGLVEAYRESVEGSVRGIVEREYGEVMRLNGRIAEMCE